MNQIPTRVVVVKPESWWAFGFFNPNVFPDHVRSDLGACQDRLAVLVYSIRNVCEQIPEDVAYFLQVLQSDSAFTGFRPDPNKPTIAIFQNLEFLTGLNSSLLTVKSLLDVYTRLIARTIRPKATLFGFNKANFHGRKLPGGRLLNWLERSTSFSSIDSATLITIILHHIDGWISDAVTWRDEVIHDGTIARLEYMGVPLNSDLSKLRSMDILLPKMPNGVVVSDYCQTLKRNVALFLRETLSLLPGINQDMLPEGEAGK